MNDKTWEQILLGIENGNESQAFRIETYHEAWGFVYALRLHNVISSEKSRLMITQIELASTSLKKTGWKPENSLRPFKFPSSNYFDERCSLDPGFIAPPPVNFAWQSELLALAAEFEAMKASRPGKYEPADFLRVKERVQKVHEKYGVKTVAAQQSFAVGDVVYCSGASQGLWLIKDQRYLEDVLNRPGYFEQRPDLTRAFIKVTAMKAAIKVLDEAGLDTTRDKVAGLLKTYKQASPLWGETEKIINVNH